MFILDKLNGIAPPLGDNYGDYFLSEAPRCQRLLVFCLAVGGKLILLCTADIPLLSDVFCRNAHVHITKGTPQAVLDHHINKLAVSHPYTPARFWFSIGNGAHAFHAAYYIDMTVAGPNGLGS